MYVQLYSSYPSYYANYRKKNAIQELKGALSRHLPFRGQRLEFLAQFVIGLIATRTVNLTQIALSFRRKAKVESSYRRIQRFFALFDIPQELLVKLVLSLLPAGPYWLTMDRTNWKWGKVHINILTVGIVYRGAAFPVVWMLLPARKSGNSNTDERITIMERVVRLLGKEHIAGLLADREFIGEKWFSWLLRKKITFRIRIRQNFRLPGKGKRYVRDLFRTMKPRAVRICEKSYDICGVKLFLSATKLDDEYLIVASDVACADAIETYLKRWEIETLFGCLKTRGFNFEDTHMTDPRKIATLLSLLTIAFCWAHAVGEWRAAIEPIAIKKHGRKAKSIFRTGLDFLRRIILDIAGCFSKFVRCLCVLRNRRTTWRSSA